jgi:SAM-dependent methyltransferase
LIRSNEAAWDRAAAKYALAVEGDIAFLRKGGVSLQESERSILPDIHGYGRAIHLQCSYGLDALSLLNLGVSEVVGVDISRAMLALAERMSVALHARALWVRAPVLDTPTSLNATADLVYTGKGALPWIDDLGRWGSVVARLLRPGGHFFLYEGHPLNWVWESAAHSHTLSHDGRGYFDRRPRANETFPASAISRYTPPGEAVPVAWEHQWTLGDVVTALCQAGLQIERMAERPQHFWPQFPDSKRRTCVGSHIRSRCLLHMVGLSLTRFDRHLIHAAC